MATDLRGFSLDPSVQRKSGSDLFQKPDLNPTKKFAYKILPLNIRRKNLTFISKILLLDCCDWKLAPCQLDLWTRNSWTPGSRLSEGYWEGKKSNESKYRATNFSFCSFFVYISRKTNHQWGHQAFLWVLGERLFYTCILNFISWSELTEQNSSELSTRFTGF